MASWFARIVAGGRGVERLLLGLDGGARAAVDEAIALRHEPPHPHSLPGREQMVRALGPQAVGQREIALHVTRVHAPIAVS